MASNLEQLLGKWEQSYKRGLLSFWILLLLNEQEMYAYEMGERIRMLSHGTVTADDNSLYRALKRFSQAGLIKSQKRPSELGPPRRYFSLTDAGCSLLAQFIRRNINVFQEPDVLKAIEKAARFRPAPGGFK